MPAFIQLALCTLQQHVFPTNWLLACWYLLSRDLRLIWFYKVWRKFKSFIIHFTFYTFTPFAPVRFFLKLYMVFAERHASMHIHRCLYVQKCVQVCTAPLYVCASVQLYTCSALMFKKALSQSETRLEWIPSFWLFYVSCQVFHFIWMYRTSKKNSPEQILFLAGYFRWMLISY